MAVREALGPKDEKQAKEGAEAGPEWRRQAGVAVPLLEDGAFGKGGVGGHGHHAPRDGVAHPDTVGIDVDHKAQWQDAEALGDDADPSVVKDDVNRGLQRGVFPPTNTRIVSVRNHCKQHGVNQILHATYWTAIELIELDEYCVLKQRKI